MENTNLLVIDSDVNLVNSMKEYLEKNTRMKVKYNSSDGLEGLKLAETKKDEYDMIVLDLALPNLDGLELLKRLKEKDIDKKILITTGFNNPEIMYETSRLGANFLMLKPFEFETLTNRINMINKREENICERASSQSKITDMMHSLGISSNLNGFNYLREAVYMVYKEPSYRYAITKRLYPDVATKYDSTDKRVERSMRHAIETSWNRADYDMCEALFSYSISADKAKPTNAEFIVTLADELRRLNNQEMI